MQASLPPLTVTPKFMFGLNSSVKNGIHFLDDQRILYPCGHNIVIYSLEDKSQIFIPGIEGSEGISAIALSKSKRFLAVCEKSERAFCIIYDIHGFHASSKDPQSAKRKKILASQDYNSREFLSVAFSIHNEKTMIATLTGPYMQIDEKGTPSGSLIGDSKVILWNWEKSRCISVSSLPCNELNLATQLSFSWTDPNVIVVTGKNTYRFFKLQDNNTLKVVHQQVHKKETTVSTNYTCHASLPDGRILICTDYGDIVLLENSGEFKLVLSESPGQSFKILNILAFSRGFLLSGENGKMLVFEKSEDAKNPYYQIAQLPSIPYSTLYEDINIKRQGLFNPKLIGNMMKSAILNMTLSSNENSLVFTTESNQIMRTDFNIDRKCEESKYDFLMYPFHSGAINSIDICLKKSLMASCSSDNTVRIWNYQTKQLEICEVYIDEPLSVAFHPSGLHLVVGFVDRVRIMNVYSRNLKQIPDVNINFKGCREIKFSNGGHLFACTNGYTVNIVRFYQGQQPEDYIFKEHMGRVKAIQWLDDDSGFASVGMDGACIMWRLNRDSVDFINASSGNHHQSIEESKKNKFFRYDYKGGKFQDVAVKSESKDVVYCVTEDKQIREIENGKEKLRYEAGVNFSQLVSMFGSKTFFAGVSEPNLPGSIHILRYPWQKAFEIQAHSLPVERIKLSYDNTTLLSGGKDGTLCIFEVKDKELKIRKDGKELPTVVLSEDILIPIQERNKCKEDLRILKTSIDKQHDIQEQTNKAKLRGFESEILAIEAKITSEKNEFQRKLNILDKQKRDMELMYEDKLNNLTTSHHVEVEQKTQEYSDKMESDQKKYQQLFSEIQDEGKLFATRIQELMGHHSNILKEIDRENKFQIEELREERELLFDLKAKLRQQNLEERETHDNEVWEEIDKIKSKNKDELSRIIEAGMQHKSDLTHTVEAFQLAKQQKDKLCREIVQQSTHFVDIMSQIGVIRTQLTAQKQEIKDRKSTISEKDQRILELKKKTQELEKFKFVLDYKIKELKRDIGPREIEIQKLNEQTNKMRSELKHFNRVNQNLALIVDDLRMRQEGLTNEVTNLRVRIDMQTIFKKKFKDDVFDVLHGLGEFKKLRNGVIKLHKKYVKEELKNESGDFDIHREYANRRKYLENSINYLRQMLQKDQDVHKQENTRIMKENVMLLQEINILRKDVFSMRQQIRLNNGRASQLSTKSSRPSTVSSQRSTGSNGLRRNIPRTMSANVYGRPKPHINNLVKNNDTELLQELGQQDQLIQELLRQIQEISQENEMLRHQQSHTQSSQIEDKAPRGIGQPSPEEVDEQPPIGDIREYSLPNEKMGDPRDNIQPFSMEEEPSRDDSPMRAQDDKENMMQMGESQASPAQNQQISEDL